LSFLQTVWRADNPGAVPSLLQGYGTGLSLDISPLLLGPTAGVYHPP